MSIYSTSGGTVFEGESCTRFFQMLAQRAALALELKGIRPSRRSVYAHIKRQYGLSGRRASVLEQFDRIIEDHRRKLVASGEITEQGCTDA